MSVFFYKQILSSWGIFIELDIDWCLRSEWQRPASKVSDNVFLSILDEFLQPSEIEKLAAGIRLVEKDLEKKIHDIGPIIIVVNKVKYPITDYQEEGLTDAILGWLSKEFEIPRPAIDVSFDRKTNRYLFRQTD